MGFETSETDWRKLVHRDDIDLIDIACPNDMLKSPLPPQKPAR
jgi:predicted dehydrogenase